MSCSLYFRLGQCDLRAPRLILNTPSHPLIMPEYHFIVVLIYFLCYKRLREKVNSELWSNVCKSLTCSAWSFYSFLYLCSIGFCGTEFNFCKNRNDSDFLGVSWSTLPSVQVKKDYLNGPSPF